LIVHETQAPSGTHWRSRYDSSLRAGLCRPC
jgi:hypothetical protein